MGAKHRKKSQPAKRTQAGADAQAADAQAAAPSVPLSNRLAPYLPLLLVISGAVAYWNSFDGVFVLDDQTYIRHRPAIRQLWPPDRILAGRRPVLDLSLAINHGIHQFKPWGYHLVNLAIHVLAGMTLFGVVRRTLLLDRFGQRFLGRAPWIAFATALIWLVHPLNTQSVTYIVQRSESMMGLFFLLSLYCFIRRATADASSLSNPAWSVAAIASCALGAGAKAVIVTAPPLILLYDRTFTAGSFAEAIRRRAALHAGLFATWILYALMGVTGSVLSTQPNAQASVGFGYAGLTAWEYFRSQFGVLLHYLRLSFWPGELCLDYNWPIANAASDIVPGLLVIGALASLTVWAIWRRPDFGFLGAWFFVILAPTSSVVPIRDIAFEHRMYLPLISIVLIVVLGADALLRRWNTSNPATGLSRRLIPTALVALVALALTARTVARNRDYHSEVQMWENVVAQSPDHARAWFNLGKGYSAEKRPKKAIQAYERALELDPTHAKAHLEIGNTYRAAGRHEQALIAFSESARLEPNYGSAHYNVGITLLDLSRFDEAADALRRAVHVEPEDIHNIDALGYAQMKADRLDEAVQSLERAIAMNPSAPRPLYHLGVTHAKLRNPEQAIHHYKRAIAAGMNTATVFSDLGLAQSMTGDLSAAAESFAAAIRMNPNAATPRLFLGRALTSLGRYDEAAQSLEAFLILQPNHPEGRRALDECLNLRDGRPQQ